MIYKLFGYPTRAHMDWQQKDYSPSERKAFLDSLSENERNNLRDGIALSVKRMKFNNAINYDIQSLSEVALDRHIQRTRKIQKFEQQRDSALKQLGFA